MKPRVKINGKSSRDDNEYEYGDTGVVDGYCRAGNDGIPFDVVRLIELRYMHKILFSDKFGLTQAVLEGRKTILERR